MSAIFADLVLDKVLQPLDSMLQEHAQDRVTNGDYGDDGRGSVTNILAWVDDVCATVPLVDLCFGCTTFSALSKPLGSNFNVSRIVS